MKILHVIGIFTVFFLILHYSGDSFFLFQNEVTAQDIAIENKISVGLTQNNLPSVKDSEQSESIFSTTTIISLIVVVMGIVAFRRNRFS